jgi:hypothetical protein
MKTLETKTGILARGVFGILASVALTAGAALGVAAELQRGFQPVYEAMEARRVASDREARALPGTANVSRAPGAKAHGG